MIRTTLALCCAAALGLRQPYQVVAALSPGAIRGQVLWVGPPAPVACGPRAREGGLAGVLVVLEDVRAGRPGKNPSRLTLRSDGCGYAPRVAVAAPGATLRLVGRGGRSRRTLPEGGLVAVEDGQGPAAQVAVIPHPYFAVTGPGGRFVLSGVPPGTYTVAAILPGFAPQEAPLVLRQPATLTARGRAEVHFWFRAQAGSRPATSP